MTEKDYLQEYAEARRVKEDLDLQIKEAQKILDEKESKLVNLLLDKEATSTAKYEGIGFASLKDPKLHASYKKEDEPVVFDLVRVKGDGAIIKEAIHWASLSKFVDSLIKLGEEVPSIFSYYIKQGVKFYDRS